MFIAYAIAGGIPPQTTAPDPVAWYWLALAAVSIGILIGSTLTQGIKSWRKEHEQKALKDSEARLAGRLFAFLATFIAWAIICTFEQLNGNAWLIGGGFGLISAGSAPWFWENAMNILKIVKPDWVKRLSAQ